MAKNQDGALFGAVAGLAVAAPQISTWVVEQLDKIIPTTWRFLGNSEFLGADINILAYAVLGGAIIGYIVDATR